MFKEYLKSNVAFLLGLLAITILDVILIFTGETIAISNLMLILLYISVDYRFYIYRTMHDNDISLPQAIDEFNKALDDINKDMEKMFGKNDSKKDDEDNSKGEK